MTAHSSVDQKHFLLQAHPTTAKVTGNSFLPCNLFTQGPVPFGTAVFAFHFPLSLGYTLEQIRSAQRELTRSQWPLHLVDAA